MRSKIIYTDIQIFLCRDWPMKLTLPYDKIYERTLKLFVPKTLFSHIIMAVKSRDLTNSCENLNIFNITDIFNIESNTHCKSKEKFVIIQSYIFRYIFSFIVFSQNFKLFVKMESQRAILFSQI